MTRRSACAALAALVMAATLPHIAVACTSLILGRGASRDDSMWLARSVDYFVGAWQTNNLRYHPGSPDPFVWRAGYNNFTYTIPGPRQAYTAAPGSYVRWNKISSLEEYGWNAAGVVVSATETIYSNKATLLADPLVEDTGIGEEIIPSVILPHPKATSARAAVKLLGHIYETVGNAEHNGVLIADAKEAWYIESAGGHRWLAVRIPAGALFASANQARLQVVDLADTANVMASPGLLEWAAANKLWNPATPFNWFKAIGVDSPYDRSANWPRVHAIAHHLAAARPPYRQRPSAPVFMRARTGIEARDVFKAVRDHYAGTSKDAYFQRTPKALLTGEPGEPWRPVAILTTGFAHVTRIRGSKPPGLRILSYVFAGTPAWVPAIPVYSGMPASAIPRELSTALYHPPSDERFNETSVQYGTLFWRARRLQALMFRNWPALGPVVEAEMARFDQEVEAARKRVELRYMDRLRRGGYRWSWGAGAVAMNQRAADAELAALTRWAVDKAMALVDRLTASFLARLRISPATLDAQMLFWLNSATDAYAFDWDSPGAEPEEEDSLHREMLLAATKNSRPAV